VISKQLPIPQKQIGLSAQTGYHFGNQCKASECSPSDVTLQAPLSWNKTVSKENRRSHLPDVPGD